MDTSNMTQQNILDAIKEKLATTGLVLASGEERRIIRLFGAPSHVWADDSSNKRSKVTIL